MTYANSAEGQADGTDATTGNTGGGSGTAASTVATDTGGSIKFATAAARYGSRGYRIVHPSSGAAVNRLIFPHGSAVAGRWGMYGAFRTSAVADGQIEDIMQVRGGSGRGQLVVAADGRLQVTDAAGSAITSSNGGTSKSTNPLLANHWYGACLIRLKGTGTGDGTLGYAYYDLEAVDPLAEVESWSATNVNAGTDDTTHGAYGRSAGRTNAHTVDYDDLRGDALASGYMIPAVEDFAVDEYANHYLYIPRGGAQPYSFTQSSGPTKTPVVIAGGAAFAIPQDASSNTTWTSEDDNGSTSVVTVLPIPTGSGGLSRWTGSGWS